MNQPHQYQSNYTNPDRTNPEISSERDALNFVRNLRPTSTSKGGFMGKFNLSMPVKISAIVLIFTGVVLSVWTMKSSRSFVDDDDLPMIANDFGADSFKAAPGEEDATQAPHSDKEFYSELEPAQPMTMGTAESKEQLRTTPEAPSEQVSQEALFVEANKTSEGGVDKSISETSKGAAKAGPALTASAKETENTTIKVVETANDTAETYKAPAPTALTQPRKTLKMAINDTQHAIHKTAKSLVHDKSLSKDHLEKKAAPVQVGKAKSTSSQKVVKAAAPSKMESSSPSAHSSAQKIYWVQIATLPTQAAAAKEWRRLQGKAPKLLKGQNYQAVRVDLGKPKGIRYRVHFGPFTKSQAIQKCQTLKSSKMGCLVVKKK